MLTQLALLPLAAVTVTGVTSETHDGDVIVEVATSEPVPARVARPMVGNRLAYIFVDDATPSREVFENGEHPVADTQDLPALRDEAVINLMGHLAKVSRAAPRTRRGEGFVAGRVDGRMVLRALVPGEGPVYLNQTQHNFLLDFL